MRYLIVAWTMMLTMEVSARVRHFTSPEIKGTHKAFLDRGETLICFWKYEHSPYVYAGVSLFNIVDDKLVKIWEDNETFFVAYDFDTGDLNGDGRLDLVVAGSGYDENGSHNRFIAFYLSTGTNGYIKQLIPQEDRIHHLAVGDTNGDGQPNIIFTERSNLMQDWVNLELKIGTWRNGSLSIRDSGIYKGPDAHWTELTVGDVNADGKAEVLISTTEMDYDEQSTSHIVRVYDLGPSRLIAEPIHTIQRQEWHSPITVDKVGQVLELGLEFPLLTISNINNDQTSSKIAPIDIAEIDFNTWRPMRLNTPTETTTLVVSKSTLEGDISRQISIYDRGD